MFENRQINGYVQETRFIASWLREGGQLRTEEDYDNFYEWLLSLGLNQDDADRIKFLASNSKMELENSARKFLKNLSK